MRNILWVIIFICVSFLAVPSYAQSVSTLYTVNGESSGDTFARSVSKAGDVNGDGIADVIVGAPLDDNNGGDSGSARVIDGQDGSEIFTVNGDGLPDFIVGAPQDNNNGSVQFFSLQPANQQPVAEAGGPYNVNEGNVLSLNGSATDPDGDAIVSFEWDLDGDGSFDDASGPNPTFDVSSLDGPSSLDVVLRVSDGQKFDTDTATVNILNVAPTAEAGGSYSVDEGSSVALSGSGSDPVDTPQFAWDLDGDGDFDDASGQSPSFDAGSIAGPASRTVAVRVSDGDGASNTDSALVDILNVAPTVETVSASTIDEGNPATLSVEFSDPAPADSHSVDIDWGDGNTSTVDPAVSPLNQNHVYGDNYDYPVTVTVTDDDGGQGVGSTTIVVVNVPPVAELDRSSAIDFGNGEAFLGQVNVEQQHTASATDQGSDDLTFEWSSGEQTTVFNNGSSADADPSAEGNFPFSASDTATFQFGSVGINTVGLESFDDDGGRDEVELTKLIVDNRPGTKTIGFWGQQFRAHGAQHIEDDLLEAYLELLNFASSYISEALVVENLSEADSIFQSRKPEMRDLANQQTLAAWLNFTKGAVGWTQSIDVDGDGSPDMTFEALMSRVATILLDPAASHQELVQAKDLAEAVNTIDSEDEESSGGPSTPPQNPGGNAVGPASQPSLSVSSAHVSGGEGKILSLEIDGAAPGQRIVIEYSLDLKNWSSLKEVTVPSDGVVKLNLSAFEKEPFQIFWRFKTPSNNGAKVK